MKKKVIIIGAGPGGLAAGMIMSAKGYNVHIYEKDDHVGGRMKSVDLDGYTFTAGPTFLIYLEALKNVFKEAGASIEDYLELIEIDPLYDLIFNDKTISPTKDKSAMKAHLNKVAPEHIEAYYSHLDKQESMLEKVKPFTEMPFHKRVHLLRPNVLKALPFIKPCSSTYGVLKRQFKNQELIHAMGFQTKYLGIAPWHAPGVYTLLSYLEHKQGVYHVKGGLHKINEAMRDFIEEKGGTFHLNHPVKRILIRKNKAVGIQLEDDRVDMANIIINNTDFSYFATSLIKDKYKKKYKDKKIEKMDHSMSTFMLYLGLDKTYQLAPHTTIFADVYNQRLKEMTKTYTLDDDISIYIHNPSVIDSTLTKEKNHSAMMVLVPVPNNNSDIDWGVAQESFIDKIIARIESKTHVKDLKKHIVKQKVITPNDWEYAFNVYKGAVFSLSHKRSQMLHARPHNKYLIKNIYLVGGGTHPGSSLPMIYQSAMISTKLITNT